MTLLPEQMEAVREMVGGEKSRQLLKDIIFRIAPVASKKRRYGTRFRWALVRDLTGHGQWYSRAICYEIGLDPDEEVVTPR